MKGTKLAVAAASLAAASAGFAGDFVFQPAQDAEIILPATATMSFPNDQVTLVFTVKAEDPSLAEVQNQVNQRMDAGQKAIKDFSTLAQISNAGYSANPLWTNPPKDQTPKIKGWTVSQSIRVTSPDVEGAASLVQVGQEANLALTNVNFSLTEQAKKDADDKLVAKVVEELNQRAQKVADAMGIELSDMKLKKIDFQPQPTIPEYVAANYMVRSASSDGMSVYRPNFEVGKTSLTLSATAVFTVQKN